MSTTTTTTPTRTTRLVALSLSQQDAQHWTSIELQDAVRIAEQGFALAIEQGDDDSRGFWGEIATNAGELLRDRGEATPAIVPVCPTWCTSHMYAALDDSPRWIHRHQTSDPTAPFVVQAEQHQGEQATVYTEDAHGDDLTAQQARAFAVALVAAADLLDATQV